jgi:hypothetical protein
MPSTFTSNTGIEKIADGEQTGLWGQTTNLNLDIIDRSLNGSTSISLSGTTHTLTTSNGLLSDGQFAVLLFAGSPSGTNTVTIAPNTAQKLYFVRNTTAETVILSQGSGATVSVLPGTSRVVFTDGAGAGAAVFDITNTLAMGSVAITGGSINGTTVGATSASTGAFTTLTSSGTTTLNGTTIPASVTLVSTDATQTLTNKTLTSPVIGTILNTGTLTLPTTTDTLVGRATTDTLTNKTISGSNNTLSNIANASLTNSSITFGSTAQALGSTVSALNGVSIGATTASTGAFTTLSASTSLTTPLVTNAGTLALSATGANIVTASTNGVERLRIDSAGSVGIGTNDPASILNVVGEQAIIAGGVGTGNLGIQIKGAAVTAIPAAQVQGYIATGQSGIGTAGDLLIAPRTNTTASVRFITGTTPAERLRITSAGNVGIGTSSAPSRLSVVGGATTLGGTAVFNAEIVEEISTAKRGLLFGHDTSAQIGLIGANSGGAASNLAFWTFSGSAWGERMRITSAGNVGIGTSSPSEKLVVVEGNAHFIRTGGAKLRLSDQNNEVSIESLPSGVISDMVFKTSSVERARIDSSGNLLVGTTTGDEKFKVTGTSQSFFIIKIEDTRTDGASGAGLMQFIRTSGAVGSINTTTTSTSYNTSSDYRLKEDVQPMVGSVDRLMALKPVNFAWKVDGSRVDGFLAHEAQEVVPECVTGKKDAVDKDGKPVYQGIDQSKIVPILTAALQEALKRIEALEAQINP